MADGARWDFSKLKPDDILSETIYLKVLELDRPNDQVSIVNQDGLVYDIDIDLLKSMLSANLYERTEDINVTCAAELLKNVGDNPFTVEFNK